MKWKCFYVISQSSRWEELTSSEVPSGLLETIGVWSQTPRWIFIYQM